MGKIDVGYLVGMGCMFDFWIGVVVFVCGCDCFVVCFWWLLFGGLCGRYFGVDWCGEFVDYLLFCGVVEYFVLGINVDVVKYWFGDVFVVVLVDFWFFVFVCYVDVDVDV